MKLEKILNLLELIPHAEVAVLESVNGQIRLQLADRNCAVFSYIAEGSVPKLVLDAKSFSKAVRAFGPDAELQLSEDGAVVKSSSGRMRLMKLVVEAPTLFEPDSATVWFEVDGAFLSDAIKRLTPSIAKDGMQPAMECLRFEAADGRLRLVATDGFTLGLLESELDSPVECTFSVPRSSVQVLQNIADSADRVKIGVSSKAMFAQTDLCTFATRLHMLDFPDYRRILRNLDDCAYSYYTDTAEFVQLLSSLNAISSNATSVKVQFADGRICVSGAGDGFDFELSCDCEGDDELLVLFGPDLLKRLTRQLSGERVQIATDSNLSPVFFKSKANELFIVMPRRS